MDLLGKSPAAGIDDRATIRSRGARGRGSRSRASRSRSSTWSSRRSSARFSPAAAARACFRSTASRSPCWRRPARQRARFEAVFAGEPPLRDRIVEQLRSKSCPIHDLTLDVAYVARAPKDWRHPQFNLAFARVARPPRERRSARAGVRAHRSEGGARHRRTEQPTRLPPRASTSAAAPRCATRATASSGPTTWRSSKDRERSTRACRAGTPISPTSRRPAGYRLRDEGSVHGTSVVRDGSTVDRAAGVARGSPSDRRRDRPGRSAAANQARRPPLFVVGPSLERIRLLNLVCARNSMAPVVAISGNTAVPAPSGCHGSSKQVNRPSQQCGPRRDGEEPADGSQ